MVAQKTQDILLNKISSKIKEFDICSLIKLLGNLDIRSKDILYLSYPDFSSKTSFCEKIIFSDHFPKATIYVNRGFLAANSTLPTFFFKKMYSDEIDRELFSKFLHFFDHHIIKTSIRMISSSYDDYFIDQWKGIQMHYLKLLCLGSVSSLQHLFQMCFPELLIKVQKSQKFIKAGGSYTKLGESTLGENSFLQKELKQSITSLKFILTTDQTHTDLLVSFPTEIKRRLYEMIYPLIKKTHVHFRVLLIIRKNDASVHLNHLVQLGYARIGWTNQDLKLLIFSGYPKDLHFFSSIK